MISIRRAFLYSLLVPLLLTFYLFSRNEYRLASVWQPMSNHSMYSVHIWVRYAAEHGSLVIPSFYPPHVQELLRHSPVSPDEFYRDRRYILRKKYPGSTRLTTLKQALEAETRIPLSIQSHFGQARYETTDEKWGEGLERETVTVYDAWAVQEDKDELPEGEVHISLVTTAWRLQEIFGVNTSQDPLVGRVLVWRHHVAILRYLRNKYDNSPGGQTRQNVEEKINEYKRLERASSKEVLSMFWDLDRLIGGVVEKKTRNKDNQSMETREREIETRLEQFWKEKKDIMERVSSMRNKAGGKKDSGVGPQSATYDQSQSHLEQTTAEKPKTMESRLDFDFTPAKEKIVTKPLRTDSGQLRLDSDGFRLRSGILLWGQLHTVFAGSMNRDFQRNAEAAPSMLPGGTITQFILKYRAAARNGKWKVRKAFGIPYPGNEGAPTEHFGWVVFHEDVDPVEVLNRCSRITGYGGISNGNTHIDKVSYIPNGIADYIIGLEKPAEAVSRQILDSDGQKWSRFSGLGQLFQLSCSLVFSAHHRMKI